MVLILTLTALAALVAAGSRSAGGNAGAALPGGELGPPVLRALVILLAICQITVIGLIVWALWPNGDRPRTIRSREGRWAVAAASFLQVAAAVILLWVYIHVRDRIHGTPFAAGIGALVGNPGAPVPASARGLPAGGEWLTSLIVVAALAAAVVVLVRSSDFGRRRRSSLVRLAGELQLAVEEGLEELEAEADARRAVIAAYARMQRALARGGLPRAAHETALEYLARALTLLSTSEPSVRRLTDLFQVARFSEHAIDAQMKAEAVAALKQIRADLAELATADLAPRALAG